MKKSLACPLILAVLVAIDQVSKLVIAHYFVNADMVLIPDILRFRPVLNTYLNWIASIIEYKTPVWFMIAAQIFSLAIVFLYYRYLSYLWTQGRKFLNGMVVFLTAGIMCSFVDVVFWGGSLDFLRLFDWFTFDLKDVYLNVGVISALIFCVNYYLKKYSKLSKEERRQTSILLWIRKCMLSSARE